MADTIEDAINTTLFIGLPMDRIADTLDVWEIDTATPIVRYAQTL
jgi:hypothetical protein